MTRVRVYLGKREDIVAAKTVRDVLRFVKKTYGGEAHKAARRMIIAVDGDSIEMHKGLDTKLREGMEVRFLPICGGG